MSITLSIDTSTTDEVKVGLVTRGQIYTIVSKPNTMKSQMVLPLLESLLLDHGILLSDITAISMATGPGSFTGLRVGAAIANALGDLLDVPVNGSRALVNPRY